MSDAADLDAARELATLARTHVGRLPERGSLHMVLRWVTRGRMDGGRDRGQSRSWAHRGRTPVLAVHRAARTRRPSRLPGCLVLVMPGRRLCRLSLRRGQGGPPGCLPPCAVPDGQAGSRCRQRMTSPGLTPRTSPVLCPSR